MDTKGIVTLIVTIVLVGIIGYLLYWKHKKSEQGEKEANDFLNGLKDALLESVKSIIADFNYDDYDSLIGIEVEIFNRMVETAKKYIEDELNKDYNIISALAIKALTPEFIESFVEKLIGNIDIMKSVDSICQGKYQELETKFAEEEKELDKEYSNNVYYIDDEKDIVLEASEGPIKLVDSDDNGKQERGFVLPNKKEEEQLNPQVDEEESYDSTDESMELIVEPETYTDSKGRVHDKVTGKYIKK